MAAPLPPLQAEDAAADDRERASFLHGLWHLFCRLSHGCALLGLMFVFLIEFLFVPLFEDGDNSAAVGVAGVFDEVARGVERRFRGTDIGGYTFIDVDNKTFSDWRRSGGQTDRFEIRELIRKTLQYGPKAVVVDIDLSIPETGDSRDQELVKYINDYTSDIPLIFVQPLRKSTKKNQEAPLDAVRLPIKDHSSIYFGTSGFLRGADGKVRSWLLAEPACKKDQNGKDRIATIPSVQLLLIPVRSNGKLDPDAVIKKVEGAYVGDPDCQSVDTILHEIQIGEDQRVAVRLSSRHLRDPIIYKMTWPQGWLHRTLNRWSGLLYYRRATDVPDTHPENRRPELKQGKDRFSGRIVVIGGSNEESKDNYYTPDGPMPGALVLINAIESLRVYRQLGVLRTRVEIVTGIIIGIVVWLLLESMRVEMGFVVWLFGCGLAVMFSAGVLYVGVWFSVSGVVAGLSAHLISKWACPVIRDIWNDPQHWLRALLAR